MRVMPRPHKHAWKLKQWGGGKVDATCWVNGCGGHLAHSEILELLNTHSKVPYTGRKCPFCLKPEHVVPTAECMHRAYIPVVDAIEQVKS